MLEREPAAASVPADERRTSPVRAYQAPTFRVVPLDCEITAYAPDEEPLF